MIYKVWQFRGVFAADSNDDLPSLGFRAIFAAFSSDDLPSLVT